jgi:hypothetical protein
MMLLGVTAADEGLPAKHDPKPKMKSSDLLISHNPPKIAIPVAAAVALTIGAVAPPPPLPLSPKPVLFSDCEMRFDVHHCASNTTKAWPVVAA